MFRFSTAFLFFKIQNIVAFFVTAVTEVTEVNQFIYIYAFFTTNLLNDLLRSAIQAKASYNSV